MYEKRAAFLPLQKLRQNKNLYKFCPNNKINDKITLKAVSLTFLIHNMICFFL